MIVVVGHLRIALTKLEALRIAAKLVLAATRREEGCLLYAFAEDLNEPGVVPTSECWETWETLGAHGQQPHVVTWRAALKQLGVLEREVIAYDAGATRAL